MARKASDDPTGFMQTPFGLGAGIWGGKGGKKNGGQMTRQQFKDATRTPGGPQGKSNLRSDGKGGYTIIPDKPAGKKSVGKKPMPVKRGPRRGK